MKRAGGIVVDTDDEGRYIHTFRQSSLNELDTCAERGRLTMTDLMPKVETDAAAVGTAVHAGVELYANALIEGEYAEMNDVRDTAHDEFTRISQLPEFAWKKYNEGQARRLIDACIDEFYASGLSERLDPIAVELPFGPITVYEDDQRVVRITGTVDLVDRRMGAADYKTAGDARKYKGGFGGDAWQLARWAIQPTVYSAALVAEGFLDPDGPWDFTYLAFGLGVPAELLELTVQRTVGDLQWLNLKALGWAKLVEADLDEWPRNDNHALCSPKWCPAWDLCKGTAVDVAWPPKPVQGKWS